MNVKMTWGGALVNLTYRPEFLLEYDESYTLQGFIIMRGEAE